MCKFYGFVIVRSTDIRPLLLTWFNFNPSMNKWLHLYKVQAEITYPFSNFNCATVEFGNGYVISSHDLHGMWLLIHAGIKSHLC